MAGRWRHPPRGGRVGRPRLPETRSIRATLKFTPSEWARIEARAEEKGLRPGIWLRLVVENAMVRVPTPREMTPRERGLSDALRSDDLFPAVLVAPAMAEAQRADGRVNTAQAKGSTRSKGSRWKGRDPYAQQDRDGDQGESDRASIIDAT